MLQIARDVIGATESTSGIRFVGRPVDDPQVRQPDTTLAQRVLGWRPEVTWWDGLCRTVDWFGQADREPAATGVGSRDGGLLA